ncbi:MAG: hypothetical protein HYU57_00190 [Micavibrio aeruginosavorus]|nr:hypothetical protein [Micavibrio aeruginosavorus]
MTVFAMGDAMKYAALFFVLACFLICATPALAQFPPVGGGGACTGMINEEGFQAQQSAVNNALYACSGGTWVQQPLILGTTALACSATWAGGIRYSSGVVQWCNGTSWANIGGSSSGVYDIAAFMPGTPNNSSIIRIVIPRAVQLPVNLTNSQCVAKTAASASTTVTLNKISGASTTAIGTAVWAAASKTCTFTFSAAISFAAGDLVEYVFPAAADAALADIAITLAGIKL